MLLIICFAIFGLIYFYLRKKRNLIWKYILEIPGPKSLPIIGTNYELLSNESHFIRERKRMCTYFPIYKSWVLSYPFVHLASPEDIELIVNNPVHNTKGLSYNAFRDWFEFGIVTSSGSKWNQRKKLLLPAFNLNALQSYLEIFYNRAEDLRESLRNQCENPYLDVERDVGVYFLHAGVEANFGVQLRGNPICEEFFEAFKSFKNCFIERAEHPWLFIPFVFKLSSTYKKHRIAVKSLREFSNYIIRERENFLSQCEAVTNKKNNFNNAMDLMLQAKKKGEIDYDGIREEVSTLIAAFQDTTISALSFTLMLLANNQDIQSRLFDEISDNIGDSSVPSYSDLGKLKLMECCIKESIRLYPPVPVINRITGEQVKTKSGYIIPKGCNVMINIYDMHRNPKIWVNPENFDPDRFSKENATERHRLALMSFSAGGRICIGQKFSFLEMKMALCSILKYFIMEPIDTPETIKLASQVTLKSTNGIRIKFISRT